MPGAVIFGCSGAALTAAEATFFRDADPLGFILFARNIENPEQVRALIASLRKAVGRSDAPVLIDQEGGRVARLKAPHWPVFTAAQEFGRLAERDTSAAAEACKLNASLIGFELNQLGIDVNCAPVLDLPVPGAHAAIGSRALGQDPQIVALLGRAACDGLMHAGVMPVIKHMPGQGRATVDSHEHLPVVTEDIATLDQLDFAPFRALADMPWGMVAHVVYSAIDAGRCASTSSVIVGDIIRSRIGFTGILIADDIGMHALAGTVRERAAATLSSGIDLTLHCSGNRKEMTSLMGAVPEIQPSVLHKLARARTRLGSITHDQADAARFRLATLMS